MRVLAACSLGGAGHLQPLLPFLRAARRRGDETLVVGPPALSEMVELSGFPFRPGGEPPESVVGPIRERLAVVAGPEASRLANRDLFGRIATTAMLPGMDQAMREWAPDLVLREPCEYASAVVSRELGIRIAQVAVSLASVESGSIEIASPELERFRTGLTGEIRTSPYVSWFPGSLDPSGFPDTLRCHDSGVESASLSPELSVWWGAHGGPRIYLSFGTVLAFMSIASSVYHTALEALSRLDCRVLLTLGRHFDRSALGDVPPNVRVEAWVDQSAVLGSADLVVCHGGSGTLFGAIAAGVPVVVVPLFADQFENARRVAIAGAGLVVHGPRDGPEGERQPTAINAGLVAAAAERVLGTSSFQIQAERLAAEMAATPTVDEALEHLCV